MPLGAFPEEKMKQSEGLNCTENPFGRLSDCSFGVNVDNLLASQFWQRAFDVFTATGRLQPTLPRLVRCLKPEDGIE